MQIKMSLLDILKNSSSAIVDVRTEKEFLMGSSKGSINIPLDQIPNNITDITNMQPVVLCCAAGIRSEQAVQFLIENGLNHVYNGGSWQNVQKMLDK
jgi:rhodanese-related sulfurtransferase